MTLDELGSYGMVRMDETEIDNFLRSQGMGVLGLPASDAPYLFPMSFGYDEDASALYFTYILGGDSTKRELSEAAELARFLVYRADSAFTWESVLLTGRLEALPEAEWDTVEDALANSWRPDLFETASASEQVVVYRFAIEDRVGIKHVGLPPAFERDASGE